LIRVAIIGSRDQESTVAADGTFEFQRVAPGVYGLRLTPSINLTSPISRIEVQDKDIESIVLEAGAMFPGKLVVDDGSPLPALAAIPDSPARVRLWAQSLNTQARAGSVITPVRASDGTFLAMLSEEEYRIGVVQLPLGYFVQSISLGSLDLLQSSLKVTKELSDRPAEIRVTLTRTPPRGAPVQRTVSGRVFGVPAGLHAEYTVMAENGVNVSQSLAMPGVVVRTGEASVRADGTFEIPNVPPGNYSLRVFHPGMGMPGETVGIAVNDTDVREVELVAPQLRSPSSAAIPPPPPLNPLQPAVLPPAQPAGVRVSGVVTLAGINERTLMPHSVVLFGSKFSARTLQIPVSPDGAFELLNVPPGEYDLRPLPLTLPAVSTRFIVDTQEVKDLRITLPPQSDLRGSLQTTEGKVLPGLKGAILKLESPSGEITLPVGENGGFTARLAHGEYKYSSTGTTEGYAVIPGVLRVSAAGVQ
jgi:hypothetical protein